MLAVTDTGDGLTLGPDRPIMKAPSGTVLEERREFQSAKPRTCRKAGRLGWEPGLSHFWSSVVQFNGGLAVAQGST